MGATKLPHPISQKTKSGFNASGVKDWGEKPEAEVVEDSAPPFFVVGAWRVLGWPWVRAASVSVVPGLLVHESVRAVDRLDPFASHAVGAGHGFDTATAGRSWFPRAYSPGPFVPSLAIGVGHLLVAVVKSSPPDP